MLPSKYMPSTIELELVNDGNDPIVKPVCYNSGGVDPACAIAAWGVDPTKGSQLVWMARVNPP